MVNAESFLSIQLLVEGRGKESGCGNWAIPRDLYKRDILVVKKGWEGGAGAGAGVILLSVDT